MNPLFRKCCLLVNRLVNDIYDLIQENEIKEVNTMYGNTHIEYYPECDQGFIWYKGEAIATLYQEKDDEHELRFNLSKSKVNEKFYRELSELKAEIGECF